MVDNCPPFRAILSTINTATYNLAKCLAHIFKFFFSNKYTVANSFDFAEEIVEKKPEFSLKILDVDSFFTNILLEETINICTNTHSENSGRVDIYQI